MQGIYGIHNTVSDKWYVGQTINTETRWRLHLVALRKNTGHNTHFKAAWDKYGPAAFVFVLLEEVTDAGQLTVREEFWLQTKRATSNGVYNKRPAAGSSRGVKMPPRTAEAAARNGAARRGQKRSLEARARMSAAHIGKPLTPERNAAFSVTMKGRSQSANHVFSRVASRIKNDAYRKLTPELLSRVRALYAEGARICALAEKFGCSSSTISDAVKRKGAYSNV
jgi:group I intron endonuclease